MDLKLTVCGLLTQHRYGPRNGKGPCGSVSLGWRTMVHQTREAGDNHDTLGFDQLLGRQRQLAFDDQVLHPTAAFIERNPLFELSDDGLGW